MGGWENKWREVRGNKVRCGSHERAGRREKNEGR